MATGKRIVSVLGMLLVFGALYMFWFDRKFVSDAISAQKASFMEARCALLCPRFDPPTNETATPAENADSPSNNYKFENDDDADNADPNEPPDNSENGGASVLESSKDEQAESESTDASVEASPDESASEAADSSEIADSEQGQADDNAEDATEESGTSHFQPPLPNQNFVFFDDKDVAYVTREYEEADIRMDDLSAQGKSCLWDYIQDEWWRCQDCSSQGGESACQGPLAMRNITHIDFENVRFEWDEPPRASSSLHPLSFSTLPDRILTMFAIRDAPSYQNAQCDPSVLEWPCFDLDRCFPENEDSVLEEESLDMQRPLAIYTTAEKLVGFVGKFPGQIESVSDPSTACLVVVGETSYPLAKSAYLEMTGTENWKGGQNHFLWESSRLFDENSDFPFPLSHHFEFAAVSSISMSDAHFRRGYDVAISYHAQWEPSDDDADRVRHLKQHRPMLLSFKGKFLETGRQPYQHHRWIAAEYWDLEKGDVLLDVFAESGKQWYDYPDSQYPDFLLNATFVFCPGGQSPGSYRFLESLLAGAIPVVITSFVAPLEAEVDWSGCLVRVSEARLIDLPEILRRIPHKEIIGRRVECRTLWESLAERNGDGQALKSDFGFSASLFVWRHRIGRAKRRRERRKMLRQSILQHGEQQQRRRAQRIDVTTRAFYEKGNAILTQ